MQKAIKKAIAHLQTIAPLLPGALIIHNINDSTVVYMSEWGMNYLNTTLEKLQEMGAEYHNYFFNPEDTKEYAPKLFGLLEQNNNDEFISFFQQVRQSPEHEWSWFLSATKIFLRDKQGAPLLILTIALPVDPLHHITVKVHRLQEENDFLRQRHAAFNSLTKTERIILKFMAQGLSSMQIAKQLFISTNTANTHRRNIKKKLNIQANYDIVRFGQAFNLI